MFLYSPKKITIMKLKQGDPAPDFSGLNDDGTQVKLSDFRGSKLVFYFYPKDMTPGCIAEACNLTDNYKALLNAGYKVVGVSADSVERHQKFRKKYDIPFPLIADVDKKIINDYGVWGAKKFMGKTYDGIHRTTFIIDENGKIEEIIEKVKTKDHTNQILTS
jgi:peroxiredoxin Q/BCP